MTNLVTQSKEEAIRNHRLMVGTMGAETEAAAEKRIETVTRLLDEFSERMRKGIYRTARLEREATKQAHFVLLWGVTFATLITTLLVFRDNFSSQQGIPLIFNAMTSILVLISIIAGMTFSVLNFQYYSQKLEQAYNVDDTVLRYLRKLLTRATELTDFYSGLSFEQRLDLDFHIADTEALIAQRDTAPRRNRATFLSPLYHASDTPLTGDTFINKSKITE